MFPHRDEPRQPVRERGRIVHTTETPHPAPAVKTQRLVTETIEQAIPAPDTDTPAVGEPPTPPKPTEEAKDMGKKRRNSTKLRRGQKTRDVVAVLVTLDAKTIITPKIVFERFGDIEKQEWVRAYGSVSKSLSQVGNSLWAIANRKTAIGVVDIVKLNGLHSEYKFVSPPKRPEIVSPAVTVTESATDETPNGISHLTLVGHNLEGQSLYLDPTTNVIGTVEFVPLGTER